MLQNPQRLDQSSRKRRFGSSRVGSWFSLRSRDSSGASNPRLSASRNLSPLYLVTLHGINLAAVHGVSLSISLAGTSR